jgi:GntR family transcriptional repressor for pyruvate dehydrogenase complex
MSIKGFLQPVRGGRISEYITEQLKKAILNQRLIPGDRLPSEVELAKKFKTSRVTIREAIRMLELYGFLHVKKGARGGTFVKGIDLNVVKNSLLNYLHFGELTVENIFEVRFILEPTTVVLAAKRRTENDLADMEKIIDETDIFIKKMSRSKKMGQSLTEINYESDLNIEFHRAIAKASHNPILRATLESIVDLHTREVMLLKPNLKTKSLSLSGHKRIYKQILNQNGELARKEMMVHLNGIKRIFLEMESRVKT